MEKEPRKKKSRKDTLTSFATKLPLPESRDLDKQDKIAAQKEAHLRHKLSPESLPSICMYTILNAKESHNTAALCCQIAEDSSMIAIGLSDSTIRVWPLTPSNLRQLRSATELEELDKESDDVLSKMFDDEAASDRKILNGHSGPVFSVSISPDRLFLLSASEDATIRLWSMQTWTNVCSYRGHCYPVWDVKFSPHGYYFSSCSNDQTARVWVTDNHQPLRVFVGHMDDVDCVEFHPSSNHLVSGSSDCSIKSWDIIEGNSNRTFVGHTNRILALTFSIDGRFLVSGGTDKKIIFWDFNFGHKLAELDTHRDTVLTFSFSRCGTILASGGLDDCIHLWDFSKLIDELDADELSPSSKPTVYTDTKNLILGSYRTKSTSLHHLHFTRRNLLLAAGVFHQ